VIDNLILYDTALCAWLANTVATVLVGKTTQILIATPKRVYADVVTGKIVANKTMTIPRITVTRTGDVNDPKRFNSNSLRRLGWTNAGVNYKMRRAKFPAPVNISYQVDFWTKYDKEMNMLEGKVLMELAQSFM
jgi:hypothetical protein